MASLLETCPFSNNWVFDLMGFHLWSLALTKSFVLSCSTCTQEATHFKIEINRVPMNWSSEYTFGLFSKLQIITFMS